MRYSLSLLLIISAVFCFSLAAATYTLPNGKILEDPYVMSQRPDGLEVGHKGGIMFVKFTDMPEEVRKKYNYDPAKVTAYEAQQKDYKEKQRIETRKKDEQEASARAEYQKNMLGWQVDQLDTEIQKTEARITLLKSEIIRLDKDSVYYTNKSTGLASLLGGRSSDNNSNNNNNSSNGSVSGMGWNGGFFSTGGGSSSGDSTKKKTASTLGDAASTAKDKADSYRDELEKKQNDLVVMKKNYAKLKAQKKAENK